MADPFVGEIRMFSGNFAPTGWAFCNGQILPISQNTALFSLIGTYYGGNGTSTFGLPNMQGHFPVHQGQLQGGSQYIVGETAGTETVTLSTSEVPQHVHPVNAVSGGTPAQSPSLHFPGTSAAKPYDSGSPDATLAADSLSAQGFGTPHNNMPPYLAVNFCIALQGIFPARN